MTWKEMKGIIQREATIQMRAPAATTLEVGARRIATSEMAVSTIGLWHQMKKGVDPIMMTTNDPL